ncbi:MAG: MoxR family ATPase [Clostridiaceae bacterium]|nr:MoxR family ATPase [Clostridiaceae bacterium]
MEISDIRNLSLSIRENIEKVIVGKGDVIDRFLIALISSGHILLEDVPGTGKTMLAKTAAKSIDGNFRRIQFTPDLLPSDLTGINFYNQKKGEFEFRAGAVFTNLLLADEINRATPRTQSALLECMEERQVTIDGETRRLSAPFIVIATQNPVETQGTFPLPEAQLDRFLVKVDMGYPSSDDGVAILKRFKSENPLDSIKPVATADQIVDAQKSYTKVFVSDDVMAYIIRIAEETRRHQDIILGVSPRGTQALLKAAQVCAILRGRDFVTPDDIREMVPPVFGHRVILKSSARIKKNQNLAVLDAILSSIPVPTEDIRAKRS